MQGQAKPGTAAPWSAVSYAGRLSHQCVGCSLIATDELLDQRHQETTVQACWTTVHSQQQSCASMQSTLPIRAEPVQAPPLLAALDTDAWLVVMLQ